MSSSSTAGPSSAPPGPSNTYTPPPAHPAFPSLIPRALIPQPAFNPQRDNPPSTPDALWAFLQKHTSHHDIIDNVIPALLYMVSPRKADGEKKPWGESREDESSESTSKGRGKGKGRGRGKGDGVEKAEKTICLPALDMTVMGDDALARNAGPMMFILTARLQSEDPNLYQAYLIDIAARLIAVGDVEQLRACGPRLSTFAWTMLDIGKQAKRYTEAVNIIYMLLQKCARTGELSGAHAAFLHGCLVTKQYRDALPVVRGLYIDIKLFQPTYSDVITFFHHAGLICAALGEYELAIEHFTTCVSVPTAAASAVQLAAAKRAYLCGLLHDGKLPNFPKYLSSALSRALEKHLTAYADLGKYYMSANWPKVYEVAGQKVFKEDTNLGLLEHVLASIPAQRVLLLRETISRLTLGELVHRLKFKAGEGGEQDVLALLHDLNTSGKARTAVSPPADGSTNGNRVVTFLADLHDYDSPNALDRLKRANALSQYLDLEMRKASREAGLGEGYLRRQMNQIEVKGKYKADTGAYGMGGGDEGRKVRGVGGNMADMGF